MQWAILISLLISVVSCSLIHKAEILDGKRFFEPKNDETPSLGKKLVHPTAESAVSARNAALEDMVHDILENFRQDMLTGSGSLPVLDPFHLHHLNLDGAEFDFPGSFITMDDLVVNHLSTFVVNSLSVTRPNFWQLRFQLDLELYIPLVEVPQGTYDAFINVLGYRVFGAGDIRLNIKGIRVKVDMILGTNVGLSGIFLNIMESNVNITLEAFEPALTGIFHDTFASNFVNAFLASFVPSFLHVYEADISVVAGNYVQQIGNDILADINVIDIIGRLA